MTPAGAIAWEFRRRYRWGWIALGSYLLILAIIKIAILARGGSITFSSAENFAFVVAVPLTSTFIYFLAVFTFGLTGDIAARQSMYPPRLFTLPVTTNALAGWPMLYGTMAIAILWAALRLFALWPSGTAVPILWPALMAASLLAWTQALTWMAYPLPGLRVIVTVLWLATIDAIVMVALEFKPSEGMMLAILAPHVPLAFLTARHAVSRARRGDVPHWRLTSGRSVDARTGDHFASASRAQLWFEWRQHGWSLPSIVAILLPFELAMLFIFRETPAIIFETLALVLLTPPFMAIFVAATVSKPNLSFTLTRPLTNASLISAKLKAAMWSTFAAWLLIVIATPVAVRLSGTGSTISELADWWVQAIGARRAVVLAILMFVALVFSTWKQLVQSLYIGMSGREWLTKAAVFTALALLAVIMPAGLWIMKNNAARAAAWRAIPAILIALVCAKAIAAIWIAMRRDVLRPVIGWNVCVFALYALLAWIFPDLVLRHYVLALIAILAVPLTRISAIPLAVEWNRHR